MSVVAVGLDESRDMGIIKNKNKKQNEMIWAKRERNKKKGRKERKETSTPAYGRSLLGCLPVADDR